MWRDCNEHIIIKKVYTQCNDSVNNQINDTAIKCLPFIRTQKEHVNHDCWPPILVTVWLAQVIYIWWQMISISWSATSFILCYHNILWEIFHIFNCLNLYQTQQMINLLVTYNTTLNYCLLLTKGNILTLRISRKLKRKKIYMYYHSS